MTDEQIEAALNACTFGYLREKCRNCPLDSEKEPCITNLHLAALEYMGRLKHRAARAERALDKATELAYTYRTQDDTLSCSSCPFDSIFDRCKERGLYEDCSKRWKEELLQQAEKELAEEMKDENI